LGVRHWRRGPVFGGFIAAQMAYSARVARGGAADRSDNEELTRNGEQHANRPANTSSTISPT